MNITASAVLAFLDTFAGQENTAEEVRDFVQLAARYLDEGKSQAEWQANDMLFVFVEWCNEQPDASGERSDLDIAIGKHAFDAGYNSAAQRAVNFAPTVVRDWAAAREQAWSDYTPPEHLCGGGSNGLGDAI